MADGLRGDQLVAGQRSLRSAMQAVADALTAHGFAAHFEARLLLDELCEFAAHDGMVVNDQYADGA